MADPLAACRTMDEGDFFCADVAGNTETSAPLSTRKERRRRRQKTERAPSDTLFLAGVDKEETVGLMPGVTGDPRRTRFPRPTKLELGENGS